MQLTSDITVSWKLKIRREEEKTYKCYTRRNVMKAAQNNKCKYAENVTEKKHI